MNERRLLAVQHEDACPPAWFGEWFAESGLSLEVLQAHRGAVLPADVLAYDGLVVLGGEMGAYDDDRYPWLTPTKELVAATVRQQQLFLGICLGHQLGAVALGGEAGRNPGGASTGLTPVSLTEAGRADPLLGAVTDGSPTVQWNNDIVTRLPADAVELAT
ncbi:MAG: type 1 glutamine amidotransferase, partial [Nocardioidaceae bacterium]